MASGLSKSPEALRVFTTRLPAELHKQLKLAAIRQDKTLMAFVVEALTKLLGSGGAEPVRRFRVIEGGQAHPERS